MDLQIVTPRQSLPRKQAYIATSNRKVDNEVMEKKIMLGTEAFARGAYEAGVKVVSSYPGTPSTEVTENAAKYDEIYVECRRFHRRRAFPFLHETRRIERSG